jgi:hypothetical protein
LQEFWRQLEQDWQEEEHPWLSDFSATYEPFKDYQFQVHNTLLLSGVIIF